MRDTQDNYNSAWTQLNDTLSATETESGLSGVISALEENQHQTGFIKDQLSGVERHVFAHPDDPSRFFRVQFNAKRLARFNGAGVSRSEEHTSELQSHHDLVCRLLLEKKNTPPTPPPNKIRS